MRIFSKLVSKAWIPVLILMLFGLSVRTAGATGDDIVRLKVTVKPQATFVRSFDWSIEKVGTPASLTLSPGQEFPVNFQVTVNAVKTDVVTASNLIYITNPSLTSPVTVTSVSNDIDGTPIDVVCVNSNGPGAVYVTLPHQMPANWTMVCGFANVVLPNFTSGLNTVTVNTAADSAVAGNTASASIVLGAPTVETDECVNVADDKFGNLGTVCASQLPKTFSYSQNVGGYEACGDYQYVNTASFTTNDTGTTGSASATVNVNVPCAGGCTLTPGYWKTHSSYGPAPYDDTWALLGGADTAFYLSGKSYYQVLWTPPTGGNAYYILAHAYIAAQLNELNGATGLPADAMSYAETFFNTYTPGATLTKAQRNAAVANAGILDAYNNGLTGPGHCTE